MAHRVQFQLHAPSFQNSRNIIFFFLVARNEMDSRTSEKKPYQQKKNVRSSPKIIQVFSTCKSGGVYSMYT